MSYGSAVPAFSFRDVFCANVEPSGYNMCFFSEIQIEDI